MAREDTISWLLERKMERGKTFLEGKRRAHGASVKEVDEERRRTKKKGERTEPQRSTIKPYQIRQLN